MFIGKVFTEALSPRIHHAYKKKIIARRYRDNFQHRRVVLLHQRVSSCRADSYHHIIDNNAELTNYSSRSQVAEARPELTNYWHARLISLIDHRRRDRFQLQFARMQLARWHHRAIVAVVLTCHEFNIESCLLDLFLCQLYSKNSSQDAKVTR